MIELSVVSPVYKSAALVQPFVQRVMAAVQQLNISYEIILVDDGSPDASWSEIEKVCKAFTNVRAVLLSRNFGQHYAITAGLDVSKGQWVVVMDSDLQDRPEEISKLYAKAQEGFNIVLARRALRSDGILKRWTSQAFYKMFGYLTDTRQDATVANFGIYSRAVINAVIQMKDYVRVFPILVQWVGFNRTTINVKHDGRQDGYSTYHFSQLFRLAFDMIISFSEKPLKLSFTVGMLIAILSFFIGLIYLGLYLKGHIKVPGYTSLVLLISFHLGLTIMFVGVVGLYVGKISVQVKNRPYFLVAKTIN